MRAWVREWFLGRITTASALASLLISSLIAQSALAHFGSRSDDVAGWTYVAFYCVIWAFFFLLSLDPVASLSRQLGGMARGQALAVTAASLLCGVAATWLMPVPAAPPEKLRVAVEALGQKSSMAASSEVWFRMEADGAEVPAAEWKLQGDWEVRGQFLLSLPDRQPERAEWVGEVEDGARLIFVSHPWSGRVSVTAGEIRRSIDLYAPNDQAPLVMDLFGKGLDDNSLHYPPRTFARSWIQAIDALLIGLALLALFLASTAKPREANGEDGSMFAEAFMLSLPLMLVSTALLGIFYPAPMSSDSIDQWKQAGTGHFNDAHPLLYGLAIRGLRAIWDNPAFIAFCQMSAYALSAAWLIAVVRRISGAPRLAAWLAAWALALHPMVSLTGITLWKDVPYATAVVALTALVASAVFINKPDCRGWKGLALLVLAGFVCMATRHNGPPLVLAALALLFFFKKEAKRRIALVGAILAALFVFYKAALPDLLNATRSNIAYIVYAHHIAAHVARGNQPVGARDLAILKRIDSSSDWRYNCASAAPTLYGREFNSSEASRSSADMRRIWFELAKRRPEIELEHSACVSALVWRMSESPRYQPLYLYSYAIAEIEGKVRWILGAPGGAAERSMFPQAAQSIGRKILAADWDWFVRPAGYLYGLCLAVLVGWRRTGDARLLVLLVLPLVHSGVLMAATVAQDARYQLPIYVIALAIIPCMFRARMRPTMRDTMVRGPDASGGRRER